MHVSLEILLDVNYKQLSEMNEEFDQPLDISANERPMLTAITEGALKDWL